MRLLFGKPELRAVVWRMLGLLVVMLLLLGVGVFWLSGAIVERFIPTGDAWYVDIMAWLLRLFAFVLACGVAIVSYVTLGAIAVSPWLDDLCVRVERISGVQTPVPASVWWRSVLASLRNAVMPLMAFVPRALLAGLFLLVPVYGTILAGCIWAWAGLRLVAFELMDAPASRRGWTWEQRRDAWEQRKWFYLGLAGTASLAMLVPVLNLFVLPAAVVGLYRDMLKADDRPRDAAGSAAGPDMAIPDLAHDAHGRKG